MVQLPQYVAIKSLSNKNYLRPNCGLNWWLRFEAPDVNSRGVKHEVVYSKSHPGKVHIRCVETGRYWGFYQNAAGGYYIAALFKQRNSMGDEDCTLFSYSHHMRGGGVTVVHLEVFNHAGWRNIRTNSEGFLKGKHGEEGATNFIIEDWAKVSRPKTGGGESTGNPSTRGGASTRNTFSGDGPAIGSRNTNGGVTLANLNISDEGATTLIMTTTTLTMATTTLTMTAYVGASTRNASTVGGASTGNTFSGDGRAIGSKNTSGGFPFASLNINGYTVSFGKEKA